MVTKFEKLVAAVQGKPRKKTFGELETGECFRRLYAHDPSIDHLYMKVRCGGEPLKNDVNVYFKWGAVTRKCAAVVLKGDKNDATGDIYRFEDNDEVYPL